MGGLVNLGCASWANNASSTSFNAGAGKTKVTFKAVASIVGARDGAPADNTAIALATSVNG